MGTFGAEDWWLFISALKKTPHTSSQLHLFQVCFFLLSVSFSELFRLLSFFPPLCHFNKIHHQRSSLFMPMRPWKCFRISFKLVSGDRILFKFCDGDEWWISKKKKHNRNGLRFHLQVWHTTKATQYKPLHWMKLITTAFMIDVFTTLVFKRVISAFTENGGIFAKHFDLQCSQFRSHSSGWCCLGIQHVCVYRYNHACISKARVFTADWKCVSSQSWLYRGIKSSFCHLFLSSSNALSMIWPQQMVLPFFSSDTLNI